MTDIQWMAQALELARTAALQDEVPVGAVIVRDGIKIAEGYNRREQTQDPLAHAEVLVIREAAKTIGSWRLTGCKLYVTLEPCPMCLAACQQARIDEVIYGAPDPKGGALSLTYLLHQDPKTHHRFPVRYESNKECGKILTAFFSKKRKE